MSEQVTTTSGKNKERTKAFRIVKRAQSQPEPSRIKLLVGVVSHNDAQELTEICNRECTTLNYVFEGFGTARTAILDYLGLGETEKKVLFSLIPESAERAILDGIQTEMSLYLVGKGICFTLPLTGISSIVANGLLKGAPKEAKDGKANVGRKQGMKKERQYDLIVAAVQSGYAEDAMEAAREAGAAGGTLVRAMTMNNRKAEQIIGVTFQQETEILMILTKHEGKLPIMQAIQKTAGLKTDAGGVLFSLPVDNLVGVGGNGSANGETAEK